MKWNLVTDTLSITISNYFHIRVFVNYRIGNIAIFFILVFQFRKDCPFFAGDILGF